MDTIETRIGKLTFEPSVTTGYPSQETLERLYDERDFQRACQAYLWSMPIVSFATWQRSTRDSLGAGSGDVVAYLSFDDRLGIVTANATTPYFIAFVDLAESGPVVVEMPERGVLGGMADLWQRGIPDSERPATYLLLGPDQAEPADVSGYEVRRSATFSNLIGVRLVVTDPAEGRELLAQFRIYPYAERGAPPAGKLVSPGGRPWSGTPPRGLAYWELLHDVLQREPAEPRDRFFYEMLRPLGIGGDGPFAPDERLTKILSEAAVVGEAMAKANTFDRRFAGVRYRPDARWDFLLLMDADDPDAFWDMLDERTAWFYEAVTAMPAMAPKRPGPSSAYLGTYQDRNGAWLVGDHTYRLRVPANPPVDMFWSVTTYDVESRCFIETAEKIADRSSRMELRTNDDGTVDIYCGPVAPEGWESNWIPTIPGRGWFAYFRFYGPTQAYFDRTWPLGDFARVD